MNNAIYPSLKDQKVVITGGGSGIGAGIVKAFAKQQANVHFLDIVENESHALVETAKASVEGHQGKITFHHCDLTDLAQLEATLARIGTVDILINNAAWDDRHSLADITPEYWDQNINVNLRHMIFATKALAPHMKAQGRGNIINFGSISWHLGLENLSLYETAKAGIEGFTRAMARELGPDNIRVNCVIPGNVETPRQKRWYTPEGEQDILNSQAIKLRLQPEHLAAMVLFLAAADSAGCTGHSYFVDAGWC